MSERTYRRPRAFSPLREHLRDTFWFAPALGLVCVFVLWVAADSVDTLIVTSLQDEQLYDELGQLIALTQDAEVIVTTVSAAMMTFIGVVFSISLVAVQMASGQLTPRVVRIFVRSRISKATLAVFLATFLFSLLVLASYESEDDPRLASSVPFVQSLLTMCLVCLSLVLFIAYVSATLRLMQVGPVVDRITRESFGVLAQLPAGPPDRQPLAEETRRIAYQGRAGVLRDVNIARLMRTARRQGVVLRLIPRIGDFVAPGTPMLAVHGPVRGELSRRALRSSVSVGVERTFHQDVGLGLRQLSDIALRALSTSVNDPTTAVQCLDRMVQILGALAARPLGAVHHRDGDDVVRLVQTAPEWTDLVDLALAEVRMISAGVPQVTRRLLAGIDDLLLLAPAERREPLIRHRTLMVQAVERTVPLAADRAFELEPDRQGIG
ncbi:DUF2254 domain-containing protein [Streptomyces sp. NPDC051907]|uniref:DUF2254 domain-containing protein n=1 Tax=Streptomyces sp. NPDC051907 TaxID=3155284 RepID=UPI003413B017